MPTLFEARRILNEAIQREVDAERNCDQIMADLSINGFNNDIEKIRNDERAHQRIVERLIEILS